MNPHIYHSGFGRISICGLKEGSNVVSLTDSIIEPFLSITSDDDISERWIVYRVLLIILN